MTEGAAGSTVLNGAFERLGRALLERVDIAWLAAFRVFFGLTMCVSMLRFIGYGWIDQFFVTPSFHFKYWGFAWVEPLSAQGMHALFWVLAALALAIALGLCFRLCAGLFAIGFLYLQLIDVTTYLNHYYLAALLGSLLALSPAGHAFSLDALIWPKLGRTTTSAAWLYVFRFQVGIVYTFAGVAKAHTDWLLQGQPLRIWLGSNSDLPIIGALFTHSAVPLLMSWAGFLFDASIAWWLLFRKTRPFAFAVVIFFHAFTRALFPIGMFPVIMVLSALVFFPADWPRTLLSRISGYFARKSEPDSASVIAQAPPAISSALGVPQRLALVLAAAYCMVQLLLPLRFAFYGGNVRWHEQGMRFSWRVMVREKNGSITYVVRQKSTGREWHVNPRRYLTELQAREMSGQPDLILQLAHHISKDFSERGYGSVEVRVDAFVSLNGRRIARMIDPSVDLARVEDGLGKAAWILPAPSEPAPILRSI